MIVTFTIFHYPEQNNEMPKCKLQEKPAIQSKTQKEERVQCSSKAPSKTFTITEPEQGRPVYELLTISFISVI